ncbi:cell division protein ZapE [Idiomarina piscisalsi]|uniref:cell division protein ZapE n=1 Tax=Idiomarina piscisalsi TaxID=1096243 RepID=UPI00137CCD5D|nr:cell division protein ZapE [Idiomarina piscisalsi]MTJ02549.1 AFG1 family ATPase [Idiomarina piscisalsi]
MQKIYQHWIDSGKLNDDSFQRNAVAALQQRLDAISNKDSTSIKSLYLYGPVGRGKTMLMDMFSEQLRSLSTANSSFIRLHYHHFMARVHDALNGLQGEENPMQQIAKEWASKYSIICLDEFFVEDIGDAMILARLWESLFDAGVTLITTSNAPPGELYKDGLARHRFEPTIELLNRQCELIDLGFGTDYRRINSTDMPLYLTQGLPTDLKALAEERFGKLEQSDNVVIMNRTIPCLWRNSEVIGFDFMSLCSGPRSQRDYMELADKYNAIAVQNVPAFTYIPDKELVHGVEETYQREHDAKRISKLDNEARRFIALVDECYDRGCLLLITAEVDVEQLYQAQQLAFPFRRCVSRLFEMQHW